MARPDEAFQSTCATLSSGLTHTEFIIYDKTFDNYIVVNVTLQILHSIINDMNVSRAGVFYDSIFESCKCQSIWLTRSTNKAFISKFSIPDLDRKQLARFTNQPNIIFLKIPSTVNGLHVAMNRLRVHRTTKFFILGKISAINRFLSRWFRNTAMRTGDLCICSSFW